jgi:Asp-tRNA(Asn)/Glu-tRNA(Gln) amidotransferase A subunit family amidase
VRSPAAFCGITGFKPSYDAIDVSGVIAVAPSLDTLGVMAWTVEDCSLLFEAVRRRDRTAAKLFDERAPRSGADLKGTRIKVLRHFFCRGRSHCGGKPDGDRTRARSLPRPWVYRRRGPVATAGRMDGVRLYHPAR